MAFNNKSSVGQFMNNAAAQGSNEGERSLKVTHYLNFALPDDKGEPARVGSIGLRAENPDEGRLIAWLEQDPEVRSVKLLRKLSFGYRRIPTTGTRFGGAIAAFAPKTPIKQGNESWRAQAFINVYMPGQAGAQAQLGNLPLRENNRDERTLMAYLDQGPSALQAVAADLMMEFRAAAPQGGRFDLSLLDDDEDAAPAASVPAEAPAQAPAEEVPPWEERAPF